MPNHSVGRRSSTNPVRISTLERDEKGTTRSDTKRTQALKSKISISTTENSLIPRARQKSCDRASTRGSIPKPAGKTPSRHGLATPTTPDTHIGKHTAFLTVGHSNKVHSALPTGPRSLSADRISSLGAKGSKKDQRLLTDKVYQAYMLNKIDTYFNANQLTSMLNSNGSIKPITLKMFIEISAYLVKLLDVKSVLTINNYVEELPKIAKKLHYPGVITKSWLKTANAMHSWPNVLRWLCWLVEICEVREIALENYNLDNLPFVGDEREAEMHRNTLISMIKFYNAWNDVKLDEEEALVAKYLEELKLQHGVTDKDMSTVQFELDENEEKLQAVEIRAQKIDEDINCLQKILKDLQNEEANQQRDIIAKENYIETILADTEQINADCKILNDRIHLQTECYENLLSQIKQQPMSKAEKENILVKCKEIQDYMQQFDEHLQDIQKETFTMDITLASINNSLTKAVLTYNKEIIMHFNENMGVDLEELKMPETGMSHPQIMDVLEAKAGLMNDFKESIKKQIVEKERFIELKSNEIKDLQERMGVLKDESSDVANAFKEKKDLINKMKTGAKNEEEKIKALKNDIKEIQDSIPDRQKILEELENATDKLDAVRRRRIHIEESGKLFFDKFFSILGNHRNEVCNILAKLDKLDSTKKVVV
ncbi:kinetochore protein Ndc80 [Halictus rubicundus]|uniref:kinetochore protein Ndc80 n=1 Tax=Halictus rubicundus TaxID=77578 RepID=UPI00403599A9